MPELSVPYPSAAQVADWVSGWSRDFTVAFVCPTESTFLRNCLLILCFLFLVGDLSQIIRLLAVSILKRYSLGEKQLHLDATTNVYGICWLTDIDWMNRRMSFAKISRQAEVGRWQHWESLGLFGAASKLCTSLILKEQSIKMLKPVSPLFCYRMETTLGGISDYSFCLQQRLMRVSDGSTFGHVVTKFHLTNDASPKTMLQLAERRRRKLGAKAKGIDEEERRGRVRGGEEHVEGLDVKEKKGRRDEEKSKVVRELKERGRSEDSKNAEESATNDAANKAEKNSREDVGGGNDGNILASFRSAAPPPIINPRYEDADGEDECKAGKRGKGVKRNPATVSKARVESEVTTPFLSTLSQSTPVQIAPPPRFRHLGSGKRDVMADERRRLYGIIECGGAGDVCGDGAGVVLGRDVGLNSEDCGADDGKSAVPATEMEMVTPSMKTAMPEPLSTTPRKRGAITPRFNGDDDDEEEYGDDYGRNNNAKTPNAYVFYDVMEKDGR